MSKRRILTFFIPPTRRILSIQRKVVRLETTTDMVLEEEKDDNFNNQIAQIKVKVSKK